MHSFDVRWKKDEKEPRYKKANAIKIKGKKKVKASIEAWKEKVKKKKGKLLQDFLHTLVAASRNQRIQIYAMFKQNFEIKKSPTIQPKIPYQKKKQFNQRFIHNRAQSKHDLK